jgi:glycerophosphoryl diester phosphodiesterase
MPLLYAHRGAAIELPENTLPAFKRALEVGADALETDAHLTADGVIVLSHDPTGARMAGVPRAIADATLAEVQSWDAGARFVGKDGRPYAGQGFRMPTLEEVLVELPGVTLNVDAKSLHPDMPRRIVELVRRLKAEDRVLLASFASRTLRAIRRMGYAGKTGLGQSEVLRLLALPKLAHRLRPLRGAAAQIPYEHFGIPLGTRHVVDKCHALGLDVHYWTVNDPSLAERLLAVGADAIMSDDPAVIAPVMPKRRA